VTAPWRSGLPFNAPQCNCPALAVNDPGLIDDDNIRREPVVPVVLFIIDKPPAIIAIGRLGHSYAGLDYHWLRVCQLLPRLHFAHPQVALGRMGGGEADNLAIADVRRDIDFARLVELVLAVPLTLSPRSARPFLCFFCFFARATPDAAIVPIDVIKARVVRRLMMR
jgi:hypothetical protein